MKKCISFLLLVLLLAQPSLAAILPDDEWTPVGVGIEYRKYYLPDPNNVYVARMARSNMDVTIESSIAHGGLSGSVETVSGMATHAEQAINYWGGSFVPATWGARNDVVVAINGAYFDFNTMIPQGGQIHSGWYAKRFEDCEGFTGFGWTLNRVPFIGENVKHRVDKNIIFFAATGVEMPISNVNVPRQEGDLILYTPQYDESTLTNDEGVEVLVELTRPAMLLPEPNVFARGYIREIRVSAGNTTLPFDHVVLSASGASLTDMLLDNVSLGAEVRISQELTSGLASNCDAPLDLDWTKTFASVQGHYVFLKEGVINGYESDSNAIVLNPRTAIAFNEEYIFFIVVDGRDPLISRGMTIADLAAFALNYLEADDGVAQDGGGSSTMVVNGEVVNNVFCNNAYCIYDYRAYLPFVARKVTPELLSAQAETQVKLIAEDYQRSVPNGMMMVVVEPPAFSSAFADGQSVFLLGKANVYTGPGTNFHQLVELNGGTEGEVVPSLSGLNGILARGTHWWRVDFGTISGWVDEVMLSSK